MAHIPYYTFAVLTAEMTAATTTAQLKTIRDNIREDMAAGSASVPPFSLALTAKVNEQLNQIDDANTFRVNFIFLSNGAGIFATLANISANVSAENISYKSYVAQMSQAAAAAPTAKVLNNTLGGDLVWSRVGPGQYKGVLTGAFPTDLCWMIAGTAHQPNLANIVEIIQDAGNDAVLINTWTLSADILTGVITGASFDGLLDETEIEIRVYAHKS